MSIAFCIINNKKEGVTMPEKNQLSGLCINCLNVDKCGYSENHIHPILFCEEFTCTEPSNSKNDIIMNSTKSEHPINPTPKGICSNCANVKTCNLQKVGEIIINCEEYR